MKKLVCCLTLCLFAASCGGAPAPASAKLPLWPEGPWLRSAFMLTLAGLALPIVSVAARRQ